MPKKNTLRESRRAQRAARRRKQRILAGTIFGVAVLAVALLAIPSLYDRFTAEPASETPPVTQLVIEDVVEGTGAEAKSGDTVVVHYTGTLLDGTKFDSSRDSGNPFQFQLGAGRVIQGWDQGVAGMKVGGIRKLTIPPELGYGGQSIGSIPANSVLLFDVELLEVVGAPQQQ
jgi:FKBP-type peptidyl-prolyl cis-trans isomerase